MVKIDDIVRNKLCVGCGVCVSESATSTMVWSKDGFLEPILDSSFTDNAIKLCPFNPNPDIDVEDEDKIADKIFPNAHNQDFKIGRFEQSYIGYSKAFRESSSSGGIATYVFEELFRRDIIQHLFVVKEIAGTYQYQWFDNVEDIKKISKTRYIPVTLENLFKEIDTKEGKVAVSGVGCFVKAIRLKQHYSPNYREKIPFVLGIICGGLKSRFFTDYLAEKSGIMGNYHKPEYRIKDRNSTSSDYSFGAFDKDNQFKMLKMRELGDMWGSGLFKHNACDFCDDVTTELADISLGDAWLPEYSTDGMGNSIIIARSKLANEIIKNGIEKAELEVNPVSKDKIIESQNASFKHRQKALKYRLGKIGNLKPFKRKRFYQSIPIEFRIVQDKRRWVRRESLETWKATPNANDFEKKVFLYRKNLAFYTKIYHYIQAIKRRLKLKTI